MHHFIEVPVRALSKQVCPTDDKEEAARTRRTASGSLAVLVLGLALGAAATYFGKEWSFMYTGQTNKASDDWTCHWPYPSEDSNATHASWIKNLP